MARGGIRNGSGRKKGSLTKRTRDIAEKAMSNGLTPLEVMLRAMNEHVHAERWDDAADRAKDAAPYMHAKLASIEHAGKDGGSILVEIVRFSGEGKTSK